MSTGWGIFEANIIICKIFIASIVTDRVSTGFSVLDDALQGGYPKGAVVSLYGRTSRARKRLALQFTQSNQITLFINTRDSLEVIQNEAQLFTISLDTTVFLDAVHWRLKRLNPKLESSAEYSVTNLTDLNALLAKIMEACKTHPIQRIVFDSPTSLLLYSTPGKEQVYKFFELLTAFVRGNGITLCYTLEKGVHPQEMIATMQYLSDGVIETESVINGTDDYIDRLQILQMSLTNFDPHSLEFMNGTIRKE